jgi:hypothetical protein
VYAAGSFASTGLSTFLRAHLLRLTVRNCTRRSYALYDLPQLNADGNGNASASITINGPKPLPTTSDQSWCIAVDYNSTLNRDSFLTISCGDVVVATPR